MQNYFPLGLALGSAFCNRVAERKQLANNINNNVPTLISSPRRFGKTSLAIETLQQEKIPYVQIDFFSATTTHDLLDCILHGVGRAINIVQPNFSKALQLAVDFFSDTNVKIELGKMGISITHQKDLTHSIFTIDNIITKLEILLKKHEKKLALFFDEFQIISQIKTNVSIEAIIRGHVQMPSHITYIFSGSNRHLLSQIFDDRKKPFYKLCDRLTLDKISVEDYINFINHAAKIKWGKILTEKQLEIIFKLTTRHPFYINALCFKLWQNAKIPTTEQIEMAWTLLAQEQKAQIAPEIELLSINQKRLLSCIAKWDRTESIGSKEFINFCGMAASSLHQTLHILLKKDYIEKISDGAYKIIDPMLGFLLRQ